MPTSDRLILGAGPTAAFLLCVQASAPISGGPSAPAWVNAVLVALLFLLCAYFLLKGRADERLASFVTVLSVADLLSIEGLFSARTAWELASNLAGALSETDHGFALRGLLHSVAVSCLGFIAMRALMRLAHREGVSPGLARIASVTVAAVIVAFGLRALLGYVTGSTSLL